MKFDCKEISISDEEFGCTLTLSEKEETGTSSTQLAVDELATSCGQYILLQRSYGEDDFESDYCYIESSDFDKSGEYKSLTVHLWPTRIVMTYENEVIEINIEPKEQEFEGLKDILTKLISKNGQLIVHD
jgi:hypothetical protein